MNFLCSKVSCDFLGIIKKEITIEMLQNILLNISKGIHLALAEKVREKIQECSQIKGKLKIPCSEISLQLKLFRILIFKIELKLKLKLLDRIL